MYIGKSQSGRIDVIVVLSTNGRSVNINRR